MSQQDDDAPTLIRPAVVKMPPVRTPEGRVAFEDRSAVRRAAERRTAERRAAERRTSRDDDAPETPTVLPPPSYPARYLPLTPAQPPRRVLSVSQRAPAPGPTAAEHGAPAHAASPSIASQSTASQRISSASIVTPGIVSGRASSTSLREAPLAHAQGVAPRRNAPPPLPPSASASEARMSDSLKVSTSAPSQFRALEAEPRPRALGEERSGTRRFAPPRSAELALMALLIATASGFGAFVGQWLALPHRQAPELRRTVPEAPSSLRIEPPAPPQDREKLRLWVAPGER